MYVYDNRVPPVKQWLALAYSLYKEFNFRLLNYSFTIIMSKRK